MGPTATEEQAAKTVAEPRLPMDPRIRERRIAVRRDEGRKRLRVLVAAVTFAGLIGAGVAAAHSAVLDVDHVELTGAAQTSRAEVVHAAGLDRHRYMVDVDGGVIRHAVERLPWVARATVARHLPGTVRITIVERKPVATLVAAAGGLAVVDASGRVLAHQADANHGVPGLVRLDGLPPAPAPGERLDPQGTAALAIASALPDSVRLRVASISQGPEGIALQLAGTGAGTVELGSADDLDAKIVALTTMLAKLDLKGARVLDLRVPSAPVLTRADGSQ